MRPVTTFPPGHANRDWGILVGITIRSARPPERFCVSSQWVIRHFECRLRVLCLFSHSSLSLLLFFFPTLFPLTSSLPLFSAVTASILLHFVLRKPFYLSFSPVATCVIPPFFSPVNTVIARGARRCVTDLSTLVLFMAFSFFKFNQTSMVASQYHFNLLAGRHRIGER